MLECKHCDYEAQTASQLRTHVLLRHPEEIDDSSEFESKASDGHLDTESRNEKGEAFGYRK